MTRALAAAALLSLSALSAQPAQAASAYTPSGTCGGLPRVAVNAPAGHCVALVADAANGLRFPRRVLEVAPGRYWLIDMGGWDAGHGRLLEFRFSLGGVRVPLAMKVLLDKLDRPHGIALGPDGRVYVGEAGRIWRTAVQDTPRPEVVIDGLPGEGAHPLKEFVFGAGGKLYINVGSATDACRDEQGRQPWPCPEREGAKPRAAVYQATLGGPGNKLLALKPYATGLRNSVALAWMPAAGALLQGENSIDYADANAPAEELNLLREGADYGWPACVGAKQRARGYEKAGPGCAKTEAPLALWPAHAAPLQLLAVPATSPSPFRGQLLAVWHGHRPTGHRVVALKLDATGRPTGNLQPVLDDWAAKPSVRPQGAPTGITVDSEGRLWVVEDRNRTLLVVLRDGAAAASTAAR